VPALSVAFEVFNGGVFYIKKNRIAFGFACAVPVAFVGIIGCGLFVIRKIIPAVSPRIQRAASGRLTACFILFIPVHLP
jgi:hypothetical protein